MSKKEFVLDENVSLSLAEALRKRGYSVTAIADLAERGMNDQAVWKICRAVFGVISLQH